MHKPASPLSPFYKEMFQKSFLEPQLHPSPLGLDLGPGPVTYYPRTLLGRCPLHWDTL